MGRAGTAAYSGASAPSLWDPEVQVYSETGDPVQAVPSDTDIGPDWDVVVRVLQLLLHWEPALQRWKVADPYSHTSSRYHRYYYYWSMVDHTDVVGIVVERSTDSMWMRVLMLMVEGFENPVGDLVDHHHCYSVAAVEIAVVGVAADSDDKRFVAVLSTDEDVVLLLDDDDGAAVVDRRQGRRVPPLSLLAHLRDYSSLRCPPPLAAGAAPDN